MKDIIPIKEIFQRTKYLNVIEIEDIDDFPPPTRGGGGGTVSGTTTGNTVPPFAVVPSGNVSTVPGATVCFNASGGISLPATGLQAPDFIPNCNSYSVSGNSGTFVTGCSNVDSIDPNSVYQYQPFKIQCYNNTFSTPGVPNENSSNMIGVISSNGYKFFWEIFKYCENTAGCDNRWHAFANIVSPGGVRTVLQGGFVEQNQLFLVRSDGTNIIWEYTTEGNLARNYRVERIPSDAGSWQFFVNGLFVGNTLNSIQKSTGSFQQGVEDFTWTTDCPEGLVISGQNNSTACYTPNDIGDCQICVSSPGNDPICINVTTTPLFLEAEGKECTTC